MTSTTDQTKTDAKAETPPPAKAPKLSQQEERQQLIERRGLEFRDYLSRRADLIQRMVRPKSTLDSMLLVRAAELIYRRDPEKLLTPAAWPSVLVALMTAAQLDLEPGGALADAYLVPWFDKPLNCHVWSLMPGYRGLCKLAIQSGLVKRLRAFPVYARDIFEIHQGSEPRVLHQQHLGGDRGEMIGTYAVARMVDGEDESEWFPWIEIERIKKAQEGRSPAWREWPDQMARKLPIKRISNQLPLGERFRLAVEVDHAASEASTTDLRRVMRESGIDPDGKIIDTIEAPALAAPPKTTAMADRIARGQQGKEPVREAVAAARAKDERPPAAEPAGRQTRAKEPPPDAKDEVAAADDSGEDDPRCQSCGVPVDAGVKTCDACR